MKKKKIIVLAAVFAVLLIVMAVAAGGKDDGGSAPFVQMDTTDLDGNQVTSEVFADKKLTLINVWEINCTACIEEMPILDQLNKDYADRGVAVMGLYYSFGGEVSEADLTKVREVLAGTEFTQLLCSEAMMQTKQLKKVHLFPTSYFVDAQGNIVGSALGSRDYDGWTEVIEKMLKKVEKNG